MFNQNDTKIINIHSKIMTRFYREYSGRSICRHWLVFPCLQVFDEEDNDVTPQPLYQDDPAAVQTKARLFLDEISVGSTSDQATASGSFTMPFSRYQDWGSNNWSWSEMAWSCGSCVCVCVFLFFCVCWVLNLTVHSVWGLTIFVGTKSWMLQLEH